MLVICLKLKARGEAQFSRGKAATGHLYILQILHPKEFIFLRKPRLLEEELAEKLKDEEIPLISAEEVRESEGAHQRTTGGIESNFQQLKFVDYESETFGCFQQKTGCCGHEG